MATVLAGSYSVTVTGNPAGDSSSASFTVNGVVLPSVTFNPTSAASGSTVDVSGFDFSSTDTSCSLSGSVIASQICSISGGVLTGAFTVAAVVAGSYSVTVTGNPAGDSATGSFTASTGATTISLSLNPNTAPGGSTVDVSGSGFSSSDTSCSLSGGAVESETCSVSSGTLTGSFLVATVGAGTYTITAIGSPADDGASVGFTIGSSAGLSMALSPTSGAAGSTVQVSVSDLSTSDTSCSLTGTAIASQSCSISDGILTGSFIVADVVAGSYTITATGSPTGDSASGTFTVSGGTSLTFNPSSAGVGSTVDFSGSALSTSDTSCSLSGTVIASQTCSISGGTYTGTFIVANVAAGSYVVTVTGSPEYDSATGSFTVGTGSLAIVFNPVSAAAGSTVQVSGSGFSTLDSTCTLSGSAVGASQTCSISAGILSGSFTVANVAVGSNTVTVTGNQAADSGSGTFTVVSSTTASLALNPLSALVGSTVQVSSSVFSTSDTSCSLTGTPVASQTCSISGGILTGSFVVANVTVGSYTITTTGSPMGDSASATFGLSGPTVTLNPVSAAVGATVVVSGSGFSSTDTTCSLSGSPVSGSTCSISGGTLTGHFTVANVTAGSYPIISTSSPVGDSASVTFVVTASTASFSITSSSSIITLTQGGSGSATITVNSLNGFSSAVTLTPSWVGSAPAGASLAITSPMTPVAGGVATSVLTITAVSSASTGAFAVQVTGTSGTLTQTLIPNLNVQITSAVTTTSTSSSVVNSTSTTSSASSAVSTVALPANCPVSYAISGSELAPMAQRLKAFRDQSIMKTLPGRAFMMLFNSWYYSFSPHVASYVTMHQTQRTLLKDAMYPLIAVLYASYCAYLLMAPLSSDLGAMLAGVIAASLLGLIYLAPIGYVTKRILRRYLQHSLLRRSHIILWAGVSVLLIPVGYFTNPLLMGIVIANLLISMLSIGCVLGATVLGRLRIGNVVFVVPALIRRFVNMPTWNRNLNTTKT
ncbi:MAG: beta strand repeat-containing protein [Candidatus Bathyarchaeia archaeon]